MSRLESAFIEICGKESDQGREKSKCKGPETAVCLVCSRNSREASMAEEEKARESKEEK